LDAGSYQEAVARTRDFIAAGDVYQANICRVLSAPLPDHCHLRGLWKILHERHGAPFSGYIDIPAGVFPELPRGLGIVSSSPELFLQRRGDTLLTAPIKGTAPTEAQLLPKDRAENLMIVDLMRNDLASISVAGTVSVPKLFALEPHPGLVHLVSYVQSRVLSDFTWAAVQQHLLPPGSVSGAPKSSAVRIIQALEGRPRGHYCGAFGIAHGTQADVAVGIRSFFRVDDRIEFGTGAGITWGSDPVGEWAETELKASRLLAVAAQERSA
jgi:para-aminobenzoate synthetase component 1